MSYYNGYSVNPVTGITTFYGETLADLALMPTTTKEGEGVYQYGTAIEGSYARILSTDGLSIYMLRSSGWVEVTDVVGSTTYSTDPITGVTTFYGESNIDLALMPTTTKEGEGQYVYGFAAEGSYAKILESDNLKIYMLRSTGWIDVTDTIGGGGSSGGGTAETTTYDNTDSGLEATNVQDAIDELAENRGTFTSGGNKTFSQLDTPSESNLDIIYNITDAFTSDERFNDGGGKNYPAGTNVACSNIGTTENPVYKYDVFNGSYTVDSALSDVSENPVQNKIVKGALDDKEDEAIKLTYAQYQAAVAAGTIDPNKFYCVPDAPGVEFDSALSDNSENAVQNKIVKAALDDKENEAIKLTYAQYQAAETAGTIDPNRFYCVSDYPATDLDAQPKAEQLTYAQYLARQQAGTLDNDREYMVPDAPAGEFDDELSDSSENAVQNKVIKAAIDLKANSTDLATVATSGAYSDLSGTPTIPTKTSDLNNDSGFVTNQINDTTASSSTTYSSDKINVLLGAKADKSETAEYPIADSTTGINPSITDSADGYVQGLTIYGRSRTSKNKVEINLNDIKAANTLGEWNDNIYTLERVTYTVDETTGHITIGGDTATGVSAITIPFISNATTSTMVLSGCPASGGTSNYMMRVWYGSTTLATDTGASATYGGNATTKLDIRIASGYKANNLVFKPMICTATDYAIDPTFEKYFEGIKSIGDSGSLTITTENSDSSESTTATLTTGLPLCGIPVTIGETYTDEQGQKWLADTADVEGVVKRCGIVDLGDLTWYYDEDNRRFNARIDNIAFMGVRLLPMVCPNYTVIDDGRDISNVPDKSIYTGYSSIVYIHDYDYTDVTLFKAGVAGVKLVYPLVTPTTQELTSAEKSALLSLKTYDSTTNVTVTDDPYVDFSYLKNTQNGKAIAQLSENLISMLSGGTPTFSFARAVYDAGDTVTATDGTTTLTSDTSGDYVFAIPNSGTWTFSDGTTTITKSLTTYGEIAKCNLISLLPASVEKNILAEIRAGHFNLGEDVGEGFKATNSNTFSLAEDGSLVTSATGHVYYDLVSANQPATIYFVGKCPDDTTITRVMARHHANSAGESPGFYTESNKILNATYYGSNSPTSISKTSLFVCAMSLSVISNNKTTYYYANDTFTTNKSVVNAGRYCYFAGTSVTANTPTDTTEYGDAVTISYIGIVNGAEDATTIAANIAAIMTAFGIS